MPADDDTFYDDGIPYRQTLLVRNCQRGTLKKTEIRMVAGWYMIIIGYANVVILSSFTFIL